LHRIQIKTLAAANIAAAVTGGGGLPTFAGGAGNAGSAPEAGIHWGLGEPTTSNPHCFFRLSFFNDLRMSPIIFQFALNAGKASPSPSG
jgi:hypothetical protein